MPLGTEVGLGPGDIALDGNPAAPTERGKVAHQPPPHFSAHFALVRLPISAAELLFFIPNPLLLDFYGDKMTHVRRCLNSRIFSFASCYDARNSLTRAP